MNDNDSDPIGYWVLAMPLAVFMFGCLASFAMDEHDTGLIRESAGLIVLTVAVWVRFRRLDQLVKGKR